MVEQPLHTEKFGFDSLQAEQILTDSSPDKEYLPITGLGSFTKLAAKLAYGADSKPLLENAVRVPTL